MQGPVQLKMTLPKIPDIELVALEGLERLSRHLGIAEEKIGEARIIVTEAIINAFEHGGDKNPAAQVEFTLTTKEVIIFVRDFGEGFEPSTVETPNIEAKLKSDNKRGWGLNLMKSLSDDFRIESDSHGTRITIRKLLA
jgi:anti-sigma regulatory factor (Ser/Thr protein kinase)